MLSVEFNIDDAKAIWKEEAFEDGFEQGIEQGMKKQINALKEFNIPNDKIIIKIMNDYNISEEEVKKYL